MSEYTIYAEGEEAGDFDTIEEATEWLKAVYQDRVNDELEDAKRYPEFYPADHNPVEGVREWMNDVYELKQNIKLPSF